MNETGNTSLLPMCILHGCVCARVYLSPLLAFETSDFHKIWYAHYATGRNHNTALLNRLTPNDPYMGRTAPLNSKRCILRIYSTNIGTEYFKHAVYSPFFLFKMQFVS